MGDKIMDDYPADLQIGKALWKLLRSECNMKINNIKIDKYKGL